MTTLLNSSVGLIYTLSADASGAEKEVARFSKTVDKETGDSTSAFDKLGQSLGLTEDQLAGLGNVLPVLGSVAVGIAGIATAAATAAVSAGVLLFDLAKQTAEAGTEIQRFATLTGFSAQAISALKVASESAGTSLEEIEEVFESFVELMLEAGKGAEEATAKVKSLGLDPKSALNDLEGSFLKVLDKIREVPTQAQKADIAMRGFGESGLSMVKIASEMEGGTADYIKKLKEMGLAFDEDGIRKAKEFDRQLKETEGQISGITRTIGSEFMPMFLDMSREMSKFLKENRGDIQNWAKNSRNFIEGLIGYWGRLKNSVKAYSDYIKEMGEKGWLGPKLDNNIAVPFPTGVSKEITEYGEKRVAEKSNEVGIVSTADKPGLGSRVDSLLANANSWTLRDAEKNKEEAAKAAKAREEALKKELADLVKFNQLKTEEERQTFEINQKNLETSLEEKKITIEEYVAEVEANLNRFSVNVANLMLEGFQLDKKGKKGQELKNLQQEFANAQIKFGAEIDNQRQVLLKKQTESEKKAAEESMKTTLARLQFELQQTEQSYEVKQKTLEAQYAKGLISEDQFQKAKHALVLSYTKATEKDGILIAIDMSESLLNYKKSNLKQQLEAVKGNAEEENRITKELSELHARVALEYFTQQAENAEFEKKSLEERLEIRRNIIEAERELQDVMNARSRESLVGAIGKSSGNDLIELKKQLRDFDIAEAERLAEQRQEDLQAEFAAALERIKGKENEEAQKEQITELYRERALISEEEFQERLDEIRREHQETGFFDGFTAKAEQFVGMANIVVSSSQMMEDAFSGVASAIGSVVQQWVLYGTTGPAIMKKVLASALATVAAEAAVNAVYATALGFLRLAQWDFPAAGNAFASAAAWAGLAGITALAGRQIAGDAFRKESSSSAVSDGVRGQSGGGSGERNGARAYSSFGDSVRTVEANQNGVLQPLRHEITLKLNSGGVLEVVKESVRNNGEMRGMILEVIEGS